MGVSEILRQESVSVANEAEGLVRNKSDALRRLATLLGRCSSLEESVIERTLIERERIQSTGVGGGVAIPHGTLDGVPQVVGAVLLCREGIDFDAIDNRPVTILFAVVGPKHATGEHLKILARISRLLRDESFRERLVGASSGEVAFALIQSEEGRASPGER